MLAERPRCASIVLPALTQPQPIGALPAKRTHRTVFRAPLNQSERFPPMRRSRTALRAAPTRFAEHHIDTGDHPPIAAPPYRITPAKRAVMEAEIEKMLKDGVIEECEAWAAPALLVPKKDESRQYHADYEYSHEAGGWMKFHREPANFTNAFLRCKAEGSNVASPLTIGLQQAMRKFANTHTDSCGIFTGVHAVFSKGDFATVEGVPLYKLPVTWAPNQPDNYNNNEDCTTMLQNGTLADVPCNDTYPYICYKKKTPVLTPCGTVDKEYVLDARTGSCYKFHTAGRPWRRAYMTCIAEGGHLAIINGDTEVQVIKDVFAKHPSEKIASAHKDVASIGFYSWGGHDNWYTIHGQTLEEAGYSRWAPGEPNNVQYGALGGENCGSILRDIKPGDGMLKDVPCNLPLAFICEMKPGSLISPVTETI